MGDDRKPEYDAKYEMAPQTEPESEKGDVKVVVASDDEKKSTSDNEWGGMNKAELMEVADTPFWNWTRNILLILFWVGWVAMLVAAIIIVVKVPRCPEVEWWEKSVFYRVFPQSYKDSNGDGYGDLDGLTGKLAYVKSIGAEVLVLSSIYKQREESRDIGQDIVSFTDVDPILGTIEDFDEFMTAAEGEKLKVILEFVPNHSSDQHPWFLNSVNKTGNFTDYYIWQDCGDGTSLPNDWLNKYGDPAWTYNADRGQCYYHYLLPGQPDLNYDSSHVQLAMEAALQFWFDHKVDGFVFSGVDYIFEATDLSTSVGNRRRRQDTPMTSAPTQRSTAGATSPSVNTAAANSATPNTAAPNTPIAMTETASQSQPTSEPELSTGSPDSGSSAAQYSCVGDGCPDYQKKLHQLLASWRTVFNTNSYLEKYRLMVTETEQAPEMAVLQLGNDTREADLVINLGFAKSIDGAPTGERVQMAVSQWLTAMAKDFKHRWNTWVLGDENMSRVASRAGSKYARALNLVLLTLPGTPISYYGEELGTPDLASSPDLGDPVAANTSAMSRSPARGPMFWANTQTGNFTNGTAWLPLPTDTKYSVETQESTDGSILKVFKDLALLHSMPSLTAGEYHMVHTSPTVYAYIRQFPDWPGYLVVTNFGSAATKIDFEIKMEENAITHAMFKLSSNGVKPENMKVELSGYDIAAETAVLFEI